jgi:hypothetical protein
MLVLSCGTQGRELENYLLDPAAITTVLGPRVPDPAPFP